QKDRAFLFGSYEGFRERLGISNLAIVPDELARQGFLPNAAGVPTLVANLNPAMLPYTSFWPLPNGRNLDGGVAESFSNPKQSIREDFGTLRADYTLSDRDSLSASYTVDDSEKLAPLADPLFGSNVTLRNQVLSLQETHVFSPRVLNTFRVGFSRAGFAYDSALLASFPSSLSFVAGAGPGGIVIGGGVTTTGLAALTSAGPSNAAGVWNRRNLFTYTDALQISRGRHQIGVGIWLQRMQANENSASRTLGVATFNSLPLFLQGTVGTFQAVPNATELGWRSLFGAWYAQDAIKIRPNLTVQVGLRHEFTTGWNEVAGRGANYLTDSNGVLLTDPRVGDSSFTENHAKRLFGPRIGLAWDPFSNGKTAVRASYGTYYTLLDALSFHLNQIPPYNGVVTFSNVSLPSILPILPNTPVQPSCTGGIGVPAGCTIFSPAGVQPDARTPTVQEWNFAVEQE
ncbi:MAG: carboxypeptidase regulatory-like domain-containing protein, partial [Terriglobia bacterium]